MPTAAWPGKDSGIEDASEYQPLPLLTEADDGSTQLVGGNLVGPDLGLRYLRVGSDGEIRINRTIGNHVPALAGGTIYLAGPTHAPLARLTDGGDLAPTAYTGATATTQMVLAASTSGAAGAEFLLTSDRDEDDRRPQPHYAVTRVSADGRIAWQRDVADQIGDDEDAGSAAITANATRVCTLTRRMRPGVDDIYWRRIGYIECLDAATGSPLWQREVARSVGYGSVGAVLLPDGKLLAAWSAYEGHHVELFDTDGRSLQVAFGDHNISGIASHRSGQLALLLWDESADGTLIRVFGPDAKQRYAVTRGALGIRGPVSSVAIDENGAIAAFGLAPVDAEPTTVNGVVYHTDPTTNRSWRTVLPPLQNDGLWANLLLSENALYVAQRYNPNIQGSSMPSSRPRPTHLYRLDRSSGSLRWHAESTHGDLNAQVMALSADGSRLVSLHGHRQRLRVETYGSVDGRLLSDGWQDCAALECEPSRLSVGGDGTFRLIAQAQSSDYGTGAAVYRERDLDGSAPPVRLGQPGIAGAWWSPYANGEGITFDWLPASRTLFGAWFTYSTGGSNAASELRWYTVQANGVADGAGKVELPILQTGGGVFDAGPTVSPQRVGTAQLEFHDCNKAILHYAFDATVNDGRQGTITLSRLSPATQPCLLSDGSSVPRRRRAAAAERIRRAPVGQLVRRGDGRSGPGIHRAARRRVLRAVVHLRSGRQRRRHEPATLVHLAGRSRPGSRRQGRARARADPRRCIRQPADLQRERDRLGQSARARLRSRGARLPRRRHDQCRRVPRPQRHLAAHARRRLRALTGAAAAPPRKNHNDLKRTSALQILPMRFISESTPVRS